MESIYMSAMDAHEVRVRLLQHMCSHCRICAHGSIYDTRSSRRRWTASSML